MEQLESTRSSPSRGSSHRFAAVDWETFTEHGFDWHYDQSSISSAPETLDTRLLGWPNDSYDLGVRPLEGSKFKAASSREHVTCYDASPSQPAAGPGIQAAPAQDDTIQPLQGFRLWSLIAGLYLAIYLIGLDLTMLSTVIPSLSDYFGTINDIGWYESAYLLAICVLTPLAGKLYNVFSNKFTFVGFLVVFELGTIICAISKSSQTFIYGRAVTGMGASGLMNGGLVIISVACPPSIRPVITACGMSLIAVGGITGPLISGALTQQLGWQWSFWIFLPIGAVTIAATILVRVPEQLVKPPFRAALANLPHSIDPIGLALIGPSIAMFLLAVSWGGTAEYAWSSPTVLGLLVGSVITFAVFIMWSRRLGEDAIIPPSQVRQPLVATSCAVIALQGGSTTLVTYYLPVWFQAIQGATPTDGGVRLLPSMIAQIIGLTCSGALVRRLRYLPPWAIVGSLLSAIGSGLMTTLTPNSGKAQWIGFQAVTALGRGMAMQMPVVALQESLPGSEMATATSTLTLLMYMGSAIGISAGQTIFRSSLVPAINHYTTGVDPQVVLNTGATDIQKLVPPSDLLGLLLAYNEALTRIFEMSRDNPGTDRSGC
ncbi:MFS general substrate transporter [Thozetella sp. PMI_491]|nr:MFS general substrate transporter [Thozetella sp. PMI_491]